MEMTIEAAIIITAKKHGYNKEQVARIREEVEKGNYSVITRDYGARDFVKQYYKRRQEMLDSTPKKRDEIQPIDLYDLNDFFDFTLQTIGLSKEDPRCLKALERAVLLVMNNHDQRVVGSHLMSKPILDDLMIEAAIKYSDSFGKEIEHKRPHSFKADDITRREACDLTKVTAKMEGLKPQIYVALNSYPAYKTQMLDNLIKYTYYENDYSKNQGIGPFNKAM